MGIPPIQPKDAFESINNSLGAGSVGMNTVDVPSGYADRQSQVSGNRTAVSVRNMVRWLVPDSGVIEMYINPQGITYDYKKHINPTRTKGGFSLQYWGEDLIKVNINGTTGSSGIEGINVLHDIYRAEQLAFDPYALALAANNAAENDSFLSLFGGSGAADSVVGAVSSLFGGGSAIPKVAYQHPTLATLAFQLEMYWSGWVFRGYIDSFRVEEKAGNLGLFDYTITFVATQRRGRRDNFMPWHHSATDGPSYNHSIANTDKAFGPKYSYNGLVDNQISPSQSDDGGTTAGSIVRDVLNTAGGTTVGSPARDGWNTVKALF